MSSVINRNIYLQLCLNLLYKGKKSWHPAPGFSITLGDALIFPIWSSLLWVFETLQVFSHYSDSISCTRLNKL